jgi:hypothetical protein
MEQTGGRGGARRSRIPAQRLESPPAAHRAVGFGALDGLIGAGGSPAAPPPDRTAPHVDARRHYTRKVGDVEGGLAPARDAAPGL